LCPPTISLKVDLKTLLIGPHRFRDLKTLLIGPHRFRDLKTLLIGPHRHIYNIICSIENSRIGAHQTSHVFTCSG
jgi:hypothetical protein